MNIPSQDSEIKTKRGFFSRTPLHPFLFGAHPIFFLVVHNRVEFFANAAVPLAIVVLVIALELFVCRLFLRDFHKSAILVTLWTIIFFWSMPFFSMIRAIGIIHLGSDVKYLFLLLFPFSAWIVGRAKSSLESLHFSLNVISSALVLFVLVSGVVQTFDPSMSIKASVSSLDPPISSSPTKGADLPDLYVIIVDGFGGGECLDKVYGCDDEPFYTFLEQQGFQVARNSWSNYSSTILSMSSIMNLDYHDKVFPEELLNKSGLPQSRAIEAKIHDSLVGDFFREKGYQRIIITEDGHELEKFLPNIEKTFHFGKSPEFLPLLWHSTLLTTINDSYIDRETRRRQTLAIFAALKQASTLSEIRPKYVYAHVICPHAPYVFNEDGSPPDRYNEDFLSAKQRTELYLGQHKFVVNQLRDIIPFLIDHSETDPMILLLSDHAPKWLYGSSGIANFQREAVLDTYQNIIAVHLPGAAHRPLPVPFHNVNLFRYVLNEQFGKNYDLLPPRFFRFAYGRVSETTEQVLPFIDENER